MAAQQGEGSWQHVEKISETLIRIQSIEHSATREREVRALTDAMRGLNLSRGIILSDANEQPIEEDGLTIEIRSTVEWLINSEVKRSLKQ